MPVTVAPLTGALSAVVCCEGLPVVGAAVGGLSVGALVSAGMGLLVAALVLTVPVSARRSVRRDTAEGRRAA